MPRKKAATLTALELLEILKVLVEKYGKKLTLERYQNKISELQPEIGETIQTFGPLGLLDSKKLDQQLSIFREKLESKKKFSLSGDIQEIEPAIKAYLEEHFEEAELTTHQKKSGDDLWVQLKGEGYIFSRSLDEDLERLLKSDF
ncbi:MAG: hypothetical protein HG439_002125 [candidate division SR1 bacterium]|nr:hypothetical protein [candidate division SR1 bacterium]